MEYSFLEIIAMMNQNLRPGETFAWRMAQNANPPSELLFNQMMPRENKNSWNVNGGTMTMTPTILGDVAMDAYPAPMGNLEATIFSENVSKFGGQMFFNEQQQREFIQAEQDIRLNASYAGRDAAGNMESQIRMLAETGRADNSTINGARINRILGIVNTIFASHYQTSEWLAGEALTEGKIVYTFNGLSQSINYNIPSTNFFEYSGNDRFDQSASKWWTFVRAVNRILDSPQFYMNSNSYYDIVENDVNKIQEIAIDGTVRRMTKYRDDAITQKRDANESLSVNIYDKAGSVMDVNTKTLKSLPFLKDKRVVVVGELNQSEIQLDLGGVTDPDNNLRIGYTHVGPSVEAGGRPGIYANIFSKPEMPMQLHVLTYVNMLPVILNPKKVIIAQFD